MKKKCLIALMMFSSIAWSALRCQTTIIKPDMTIEEVKRLCGEPAEETEKKENLVCYSEYASAQSICEKIQTQTLVYKRPSRYNIEFRNDRVFRIDLRIYDH